MHCGKPQYDLRGIVAIHYGILDVSGIIHILLEGIAMIQKMMSYLMNNREVATLVADGRASLVGVTPAQQKAMVDVLFSKKKEEPKQDYYWC